MARAPWGLDISPPTGPNTHDLNHLWFNSLSKHHMETQISSLLVSSPAFISQGAIPDRFTCQGENINPPLAIDNIPPQARSLAIIMEDPDASRGTFDHWVVWNIEPVSVINEGSAPGISGTNNFGKKQYNGPCPPSGIHRYYIKVFALDSMLDLPEEAGKKELLKAMDDHILSIGELLGHYQKKP